MINSLGKTKGLRWLLTMVLPVSFVTSCSSRYSVSSFKMIANNPLKAQDSGFNQAAWEGMLKVDSNLNEALDVLYPDTQDDPNMITPAITKTIDDGYLAVVLPGFTYVKTVLQPNFFDVYDDNTYFLTVDLTVYEMIKSLNTKAPDKYYEILVDESKPGFAAAIDVAGQILQRFKVDKDHMGLPVIKNGDNITVKMTGIGGLNIPAIKNYMIGFNKGLRWFSDNILANDIDAKDGKLQFEWFAGTFNGGFGTNDAIKTAQTNTNNAINNNVGVIFNISVPEGNTILKQIAAANANTWFIGVDVDQANDKNLAGYKHLIKSSALKDVSFAVKTVLDAINYRIKNNNAIDYENEYSTPGTKSFIWEETKQVSLVPMNGKDFNNFYIERVGSGKLVALKKTLAISVEDLRKCNETDMLGDIANESVCEEAKW
ncbi:hypothetical protein [Spiroplasma endosymbiont of Agriotes lineatus]|uniref:hypothetical protein n=1 Tax=Spiroplasma endosymbiont of Agriotes lineatus TaxID=3077930 RepID=UPI0030D46882